MLQSQRDTSAYVKRTMAYVSAILTCCGFVFPAHMDVGAVAKWLNSLQSSGPKVELPAGFTGFAVKDVAKRLGISTDAVAGHVTLVLAYQGVVLGDVQGRLPASGTLVMLGDRSSRVKITVRHTEVRRIVETLRNWSGAPAADVPLVVLN